MRSIADSSRPKFHPPSLEKFMQALLRPSALAFDAEEELTTMSDGMSGMMGGMSLIWTLLLILVVLGIAALTKYLWTK